MRDRLTGAQAMTLNDCSQHDGLTVPPVPRRSCWSSEQRTEYLDTGANIGQRGDALRCNSLIKKSI